MAFEVSKGVFKALTLIYELIHIQILGFKLAFQTLDFNLVVAELKFGTEKISSGLLELSLELVQVLLSFSEL